MLYQMVPFSMTLNDPKPDFNGMPLFNVEYLRNNMRQTHDYYRALTESDMWPTELCHCQ